MMKPFDTPATFRVDPPPAKLEPTCAHDAAVAAPVASPVTSLGTLLASHILRDGELVILILKPSPWFILLSSLPFLAGTLIAMIAVKIFQHPAPGAYRPYAELGTAILVGRLLWATLQWMGRLYILTDLRILRLSGVFSIDVFDCPLRKVARTRLYSGVADRLLRVGSIDIVPADETCRFLPWQMVSHPIEVHTQIQATIARSKQGGLFAA